jgi:hypothetical protein
VVAVALGTTACGGPSDGEEGGLAALARHGERQETVGDVLCAVVAPALATRLGIGGATGSFANEGFYASCAFERGNRGLEVRVGLDGASIQESHFHEAGAVAVEVDGADRAVIVDRPLYAGEDGKAGGFTVAAEVGDDLVQVVVTGAERDSRTETAAIEVAEAALALPRS